MDLQEELVRQKKSLEIAEFERKLFEEQAKDLETAIEARREEMQRAGDLVQKELLRDTSTQAEYSRQDIEETRAEQQQEMQIVAQQEADQDENTQRDERESLLERAREFLREKGHPVENEDLVRLSKEKPRRPDFPVMMLTLAILKDIFDLILTLTIVGIVLVFIYSALYMVVSFVWTMSRVSRVSFVGKQAIKMVRNKAVKAYLTRNGLEIVPGAQVLPLATLFVILNHYSDTKLVQTFVQAAEMLEGVDFDGEE